MSLIGSAALVVIAAQLLATVAFQFAPLKSRYPRLDLLGVLPRWQFFIPGSGSLDFALIGRAQGVRTGDDGWQTLWEMPPRGGWTWLWAPDPGDDQNIWFALALIDRRARQGRPLDAENSHAYAKILKLCRARLQADPGRPVQFAVMRVGAEGAFSSSYTSPVHDA